MLIRSPDKSQIDSDIRNANAQMPEDFGRLFWEYDFKTISWERDRDLVIDKILTRGDWHAIRWLRDNLGDIALKEWIIHRRGRSLTKAQLRFWELVLAIPTAMVNEWLRSPARQTWDNR